MKQNLGSPSQSLVNVESKLLFITITLVVTNGIIVHSCL